MKHKASIFYFGLFLLVATISAIILYHADRELSKPQESAISTFVKNGDFTEYDKQGKIKTKITAEKIIEYRQDGKIVFQHPYLIVYTTQRTPWHIRADQAVSDKAGEKVELAGNVVLHELKSKSTPASLIQTTKLTLFPKKRIATTDEPIVLSRPGVLIHGIGLTANLKTGQYELKSHPEIVYQPNKKE